MSIPGLTRATALRLTLLTGGFLALLVWQQLPWIRYTLSSPDDGRHTETLRIFSRDCSEQRGGDFQVEIADSDEQRRSGLQHRQYLPSNRGMLFLWPDNAIRSMWMRDVSISLDFLFIREDGSVIEMAHRRRPNSDRLTISGLPARAVLELRGGLLYKLGIRGGDRIQHPAFSGRNCATATSKSGQ